MDGARGLGGLPLDRSTLIRLVLVVVLALVVRQAVLHFGRKMVGNKNQRNGKRRR
jgi:hypothetical protein